MPFSDEKTQQFSGEGVSPAQDPLQPENETMPVSARLQQKSWLFLCVMSIEKRDLLSQSAR